MLGLLPELQCILMQTFGFALSLFLKSQPLLTNLIQLLHGLEAIALMLFAELTLQLIGFLIKLLTALQGLLFQLLSTGGVLLLQLGLLGLHLLFHLRGLMARRLQKLLTLLANLFPHLIHLPLSFLTNRGLRHQLFALLLRSRDDFVCLGTSRGDELVTLLQQLISLRHLGRHGLANRVQQLNGILLIHKPATAEGNSASLEHDLLKLIELVEYGEPDLAHRDGGAKAELKNLARSSATTRGTM
ncbi:hypothetical protein SynBMKMC1_01550 [Synechococcus sp. BMK-MC-1]|nr:hypothetical protein SynBMKMC1_01550 [Synechococcus sp. BMK-MC-1]